MSIQTSAQETINALNVIFDKHKNERICVLATTCCGKTTLLKQIPDCVDLDDELLAEYCKKRGNNFTDSKNVKESIEEDWNYHRKSGEKVFYYLTVTE